MTAAFTCNVCKEPVPREDANCLERKDNGIRVSAHIYGKDLDGTHLCAGCASGILIAGTRPVRDPDEVDF